MRKIKVVLVAIALLLGGGTIFAWSKWQPCSTVRECYWSWKAFTSGAGPMEGRRLSSIYDGFTASTALLAFQVPVSLTDNGILLVDRAGRRAATIAQEGYSQWSPRFSDDGERLVFARAKAGDTEQELVSCVVGDWHCTILFRSTSSISSPVDLGDGKVLFALGYPLVRDGKVTQYRRFDLHIVSAGSQPVRMTEFDLFSLHAITVSKNKIYFQALGGKSEMTASSCSDRIKCDSSEIFYLDFDRGKDQIAHPPEKLKPVLLIDGLSLKPALSANGTRLAFLNTTRKGNPWRYNLEVFDGNGTPLKTIEVSGIAFSAGAFVGDTMLVNELFKDRYHVSIFDRSLNRIDFIDIDNSPDFLSQVHRIEVKVDAAGLR